MQQAGYSHRQLHEMAGFAAMRSMPQLGSLELLIGIIERDGFA
jgi:hypothetical protein